MFYTVSGLSIDIRVSTLILVSLPKCDPLPLVFIAMDSALYASLDVCECNIPCVCENASKSVNPYNCDDMLLEFIGVVEIPNDKLLKKKAKKFHKNLSKFICENDDLIDKLNESNKLDENIRNLLKIHLKS